MHGRVFAGIDPQARERGFLPFPRDDDFRTSLRRTLGESPVVHAHQDDHAGWMDRGGTQRSERDLARHELADAGFEVAVLLGQLREEAERDRGLTELGHTYAHAGQGAAELGKLFEVLTGTWAE